MLSKLFQEHSLSSFNWLVLTDEQFSRPCPCLTIYILMIQNYSKFTACFINRVCRVRSTIPKFFVRFLRFLQNRLTTDRQFINSVVKSLTFSHEAIYQNFKCVNRHVVKHGLDWTGKTRTESVICKTRTESVICQHVLFPPIYNNYKLHILLRFTIIINCRTKNCTTTIRHRRT